MTERIAIVTTLRDAESVLDSFITYHLLQGFDRIFLFFDDPHARSIERARGRPNVTTIPHDAELARRWTTTSSYEKMAPYISNHVMARQVLNAEVAIDQATQEGFDWLLHIDADELFYSPRQTLRDHLASLTSGGIECVIYPNHEAVPEKIDVEDHFKEVTLFKRNVYTLAPHRRRFSRPFLFYYNGKTAVRLQPGITANGVHDFHLPERKRRQERYFGFFRSHKEISARRTDGDLSVPCSRGGSTKKNCSEGPPSFIIRAVAFAISGPSTRPWAGFPTSGGIRSRLPGGCLFTSRPVTSSSMETWRPRGRSTKKRS